MDIPRIKVGSKEMVEAFLREVSHYTPLNPDTGVELKEEAGITDHSTSNLQIVKDLLKVVGKSFSDVESIEVGGTKDDPIFLIRIPGFEYLATGFGIGYGGTGPSALARFAKECGFGDDELILKKRISTVGSGFRGVLFERLKKTENVHGQARRS